MWSWLIGLAAKYALSKTAVFAIGGLLAVGVGAWTIEHVRRGHAEAELEAAIGRIDKLNVKIGGLETQLAVVTANRDELQAEIGKQNAAIEDLRHQAEVAKLSADAAAAKVLAAGAADDAQIQNAPSQSPEDANRWLKQLFLPAL